LAGDTAADIMREIGEEDRADVYGGNGGSTQRVSLITAEWYDSCRMFAVDPRRRLTRRLCGTRLGGRLRMTPAAGATERLVFGLPATR
jgi:hypothetical protein